MQAWWTRLARAGLPASPDLVRTLSGKDRQSSHWTRLSLKNVRVRAGRANDDANAPTLRLRAGLCRRYPRWADSTP
ncbi:hypothetical protein G6F54_014393 [Rhizopus delemar]|nr:hypothetical protein G6F54_014393 [Rhizopus delemar]